MGRWVVACRRTFLVCLSFNRTLTLLPFYSPWLIWTPLRTLTVFLRNVLPGRCSSSGTVLRNPSFRKEIGRKDLGLEYSLHVSTESPTDNLPSRHPLRPGNPSHSSASTTEEVLFCPVDANDGVGRGQTSHSPRPHLPLK